MTRAQIWINLEECIWRAPGNFEEHKVLECSKIIKHNCIIIIIIIIIINAYCI